MVWNYRSYGGCGGKPTSKNMKKDAESVVNFLKFKMNVIGKIGIYGRSLGGVPACYVASLGDVDMLIADRTLSNFDHVARDRFYGDTLLTVFKIVAWDWTIDCS
jgi:hypothetical protein